jgi:hypothetical protein
MWMSFVNRDETRCASLAVPISSVLYVSLAAARGDCHRWCCSLLLPLLLICFDQRQALLNTLYSKIYRKSSHHVLIACIRGVCSCQLLLLGHAAISFTLSVCPSVCLSFVFSSCRLHLMTGFDTRSRFDFFLQLFCSVVFWKQFPSLLFAGNHFLAVNFISFVVIVVCCGGREMEIQTASADRQSSQGFKQKGSREKLSRKPGKDSQMSANRPSSSSSEQDHHPGSSAVSRSSRLDTSRVSSTVSSEAGGFVNSRSGGVAAGAATSGPSNAPSSTFRDRKSVDSNPNGTVMSSSIASAPVSASGRDGLFQGTDDQLMAITTVAKLVPLEGPFPLYLPQDDAVAAGLGGREGGIDVSEAQEVVDILNQKLAALLRLDLRQFWKQGEYEFDFKFGFPWKFCLL